MDCGDTAILPLQLAAKEAWMSINVMLDMKRQPSSHEDYSCFRGYRILPDVSSKS